MDRVQFRTLGTADLRLPDGSAVLSVLAQPKRVALLSLLADRALGDFVRRDTICATFWPDADQSQARHRLRSAIHMIRKAIGHDVIVSRGDEELGLSETGFWFDVDTFDVAVAEGRHDDALELYRGDFLDGFHVAASHEFEEWVRSTRNRLRDAAAGSGRHLAQASIAANDVAAALSYATRARQISPEDEAALRLHMEALDAAGRRAEALREFERYAERLAEEIGAEPAPETSTLAESIRDRTAAHHQGAPTPGPVEGSAANQAVPGSSTPAVVRGGAGSAAALTAATALAGAAFFAARVAVGGEGGETLPGASLLSYLASWLILIVGIWFLFERAEETASPGGRARVAAWLGPRARAAAAEAGWAEGFISAFDRIFGPRHLSLHCFIRSMAASIVAATIVLLLWVAIRPEQFAAFSEGRGLQGLGEVVLITFIVNVIADYLSLLETRLALGFLRRWKASWKRAFVIVFDALATFAIWLGFYTGLPFLALAGVSSIANDIMLFLQFQVWSYGPTIHDVMSLSAGGDGPPVGIWFYSTFLTSVWLWLYLGAGAVARSLGAAGDTAERGVSRVAALFDAHQHPFRVLGLVSILIVTVAYALGWLINLI